MNAGSHTTRRVTANLPTSLLEDACRVTGKGMTETLIRGLALVQRSAAVDKARALRGKLHIDLDMELSRERSRR